LLEHGDGVADGDLAAAARRHVPAEERAGHAPVRRHAQAPHGGHRVWHVARARLLVLRGHDATGAGFDEIEADAVDLDRRPAILRPRLVDVDDDIRTEPLHADGAFAVGRKIGIQRLQRTGCRHQDLVAVGKGNRRLTARPFGAGDALCLAVEEHQLYFAPQPFGETAVAVVVGNGGVHRLFPDRHIHAPARL